MKIFLNHHHVCVIIRAIAMALHCIATAMHCSISDVKKTSRVCICSNHLNIQLELTEHLGVAGADLLQHIIARLVQTRPHSACLRIIWIVEQEN